MKKRLFISFLLALFCLLPKLVFASESISLVNIIENTNNPMNVQITYELKNHYENPEGVVNVPEQFTVNFQGVEVVEHKLTKEVQIDFSNTTFPQEGIYRYGLTQKEVTSSSVVISKKDYEIYVTVTRRDDGTFEKEVNPLALNFAEAAKESIEYFNTTNLTSIVLENRLDGELKEYDKDIYFRYRISIEGPIGDVYSIIGQDEEVVFDGRLVDTTNQYVVKGNSEENYIDVYLKDDQRITIGLNPSGFSEIPIGIRYKVKKISGEKWITKINSEETVEKTYTTKSDSNSCLIVNKRDYDSAATGLFYRVLPYVLLIGMILFSIGVMIHFKKEKKEM